MQGARAFCAQRDHVKRSIPVVQNGQGFTCGFIGIGKESGSADRIEVKEAFSNGYEWPSGTAPAAAIGLQGPHVWPDGNVWDSAHRDTMNEFYIEMVKASRTVAKRLSESLYGDEKVLGG